MIEQLLAGQEGKNLEFKENTNSLQRIIQTVIAFANTGGGVLVVGVKDGTKEIVGVDNVLVEELKIANAIADSIAPLLVPTLQIITYRKKDLLLITVPHCIGPFYLKSAGLQQGTFIRIGSTNRPADAHAISEIVRLKELKHFDEMPNMQCPKEDIDLTLAKELFAEHKKKFTESSAESLGLFIQYQGMLYPTNGAVLLFGKNPQRYFPTAQVRLVRFLGTDKSEVLDHQDIEGPLVKALDTMLAFVRRNTAMAAKFGGLYREDIPQYPTEIVREAFTNALLHADYMQKGATIQVSIFADRIEIINPGGLLFGLNIERALSGVSQLRNIVIGRVFRELEIAEQWGSGLRRMVEIAEQSAIRSPVFEDLTTFFRVILYPRMLQEQTSIKNDWEDALMQQLKDKGSVTAKQAQQLWQVTARTTSDRLKQMVTKKIIAEIGTSTYDPQKIFAAVQPLVCPLYEPYDFLLQNTVKLND